MKSVKPSVPGQRENPKHQSSWQRNLGGWAALIVALTGAMALYLNRPSPSSPSRPLVYEKYTASGTADAKIKINKAPLERRFIISVRATAEAGERGGGMQLKVMGIPTPYESTIYYTAKRGASLVAEYDSAGVFPAGNQIEVIAVAPNGEDVGRPGTTAGKVSIELQVEK